jgi:hypothetical protein
MLRHFLTLTVAAVLLGPFAANAQTPPPAPSPATAPAAPDAPAPAAKPHTRVRGKISVVDATAKTVTLVNKRDTITLTVPDDAKIYKVGDAKGSPTGTFADLTVDTMINATTKGDATAPVAKTIHIRAPKTAAPATP